jgi:HAAS
MSSTADKLVDDYLKRLDSELSGLPRARRRELVDEISGHIAAGRADLESENEAAIRTLLDRLGDPADIAAEATERFEPRAKTSGWREVVALIMLLVGGLILPVIGWFVGLVLLWLSDAWSTRDKLIGTLLFPGGLFLPLGLGVMATGGVSCEVSVGGSCQPNSGSGEFVGPLLLALLVLVPIGTTIYLARRMGRMSTAPA